MRAVIYARVSSDEQADRGLSIPTQIKICKDFIQRQGWTFVKEYIDEGISGLKSDRPSFMEMLSDAQNKKFDIIVVYSLSRFSRDRFDAITKKKLLKDLGIEDGDILLVDVNSPIESGSLVIAIIDNKATFNRFRRVNGKIFLEPANSDYKPIELTNDMNIKMYKVIMVIKNKEGINK